MTLETPDTPPDAPHPPEATPIVPPEIARLLGAPPVLRGENASDYDDLFDQLALARQPRDFLEWLALKEEADALWEVRRLQSVKRALIDTETPAAARRLLPNLEGGTSSFSERQKARGVDLVTQGMQRGDKADRAAIDASLASGGLTRDALTASAVVGNLGEIERLERLSRLHAQRRGEISRERERHHFALSQRPRAALEDITDLDAREVVS